MVINQKKKNTSQCSITVHVIQPQLTQYGTGLHGNLADNVED